ncbi:MAG: hypothetical protein ABI947_20995 [Chloroflexota bacterium]
MNDKLPSSQAERVGWAKCVPERWSRKEPMSAIRLSVSPWQIMW